MEKEKKATSKPSIVKVNTKPIERREIQVGTCHCSN